MYIDAFNSQFILKRTTTGISWPQYLIPFALDGSRTEEESTLGVAIMDRSSETIWKGKFRLRWIVFQALSTTRTKCSKSKVK